MEKIDRRKLPKTEQRKAQISASTLGRKKLGGDRNKIAKSKGAKPFVAYRVNEEKPIGTFYSPKMVAEELDISVTCILDCLKGKRESTKGYRFIYEEFLLPKRGIYRYINPSKLKDTTDPGALHLAKRIHVEQSDRLADRIRGRIMYSEEFKALVLRLLTEYRDIDKVARLSGVPEQSIYVWLMYWNKAQQKAQNAELPQGENFSN